MERVSVIEGRRPIIFVAPHGFPGNDLNTDIIAEEAARSIGAYAVINRGWERAPEVDVFKDKANCNNINHCLTDVVRDEFLIPIERFVKRIQKTYFDLMWTESAILKNDITKKYKGYENGLVHIFIVHGVGQNIEKITGKPVTMIVGNGMGKPPSHTCPYWMKKAFMYYAEELCGQTIFAAGAGSPYSGWARNNLNQYYRKHDLDKNVMTLQIEIGHKFRSPEESAILTANALAICAEEVSTLETFKRSYEIQEI